MHIFSVRNSLNTHSLNFNLMFLSENKNQPKYPEFVLITIDVRPSVGQFEKSRFLLRLDFRCFLGPP